MSCYVREQSPIFEANCSSPGQEIPCFLCNLKVQYRVHNIQPCVLLLSHIIQSTPFHPVTLRSMSILPYNLHLGLPIGFFPSGFHGKSCAYFSSPETLPADHSPPSGVEVKNEWSYTSSTPIFLHGVDRANFTS